MNNAPLVRELDDLLNSGAKRVRVGDTDTEIDHELIRKRQEELRRADPKLKARRKKVSSINLGSAW